MGSNFQIGAVIFFCVFEKKLAAQFAWKFIQTILRGSVKTNGTGTQVNRENGKYKYVFHLDKSTATLLIFLLYPAY